MKLRRVLIFSLLLVLGIVVHEVNTLNLSEKEIISMTDRPTHHQQSRIADPYENIDSWKIPVLVPLSEQQKLYVIEVMSAMMRVMSGSSSLEAEEERILGKGKFRWPKNPAEPIKVLKSYFGENFRMAGISASFRRESENAFWANAGLAVHPRNFPAGVYLMQLPSTVFSEFELIKVSQEERENERVQRPIVFYFEHKKVKGFNLKVEARDDVVSVRDPFPSSFHAAFIKRDPSRTRSDMGR